MWYLFCFIFAFIVTSQAAPSATDPYAEDMKQRNQMALECMDQVKIDQKIIRKAIRNPYDLPTESIYKDYLACSYKKQKFQSESGEILYDNLYDFLSRFYNRSDLKIIDQCKTITAETDGEMAYDTLKCVLNSLRLLDLNNKLN